MPYEQYENCKKLRQASTVTEAPQWLAIMCSNYRRLKFYALTHNTPKNPEDLKAISLLQVRHLIYLFLMILGPNFKRLCSDRV